MPFRYDSKKNTTSKTPSLPTPDSLNDLQMVQALHAGDTKILDMVYERYAPALYTLIAQMLPDDDKRSEVLILTFKSIPGEIRLYDPSQCTLFIWLMRLARQTALGFIKADAVLPGSSTNTCGSVDPVVHSSPAFPEWGLRRVLSQMDPESRGLIDRHYFQGCGIHDLSREFGLTEDVAAARVRGALVQFRRKLASGE